jgi:hypothetical protein
MLGLTLLVSTMQGAGLVFVSTGLIEPILLSKGKIIGSFEPA